MDDKGMLPMKKVMDLVGMGVSFIPGVTKQGEKGVKLMVKGAIMLADDLAEGKAIDKAIDVDG